MDTLQKVKQDVSELKQEMKELTRDMRDLEKRTALNERDISEIKEDLKGIKNNTTWILRIIIGSIVTTLIGAILKGGLI